MGNHWYRQDGTPQYTVLSKDGKERDTTLRDARKLNLFPSVTTIMNVMEKQALVQWKLEQFVVAAKQKLEYKRIFLEEEEIQHIWKMYKENTEQYAKKGAAIHDGLERYFRDGTLEPKDEMILLPTIELVEKMFIGKKIPEQSFACKEGYGGKIDLIVETEKEQIIIDFKTKKGDLTKVYTSNEYLMQLTAYRKALQKNARCINIFISTDTEVTPKVHEWYVDELEKGYQMFDCLKRYWQISTGYIPEYL